MSLSLTTEQIEKLQSLGIKSTLPLNNKKTSLLPLLSISGFTIISFGSLFLLKNKQSSSPVQPTTPIQKNTEPAEVPTQVPKSIQHYLLASQQLFTQALQAQNSKSTETAKLLNQSITAVTEAIKYFPSDSRGYEQRARIYQSLIDSQPQFLEPAISDFLTAAKYNPNSAEITRSLATLYGRKGDAQSTLAMLNQTVTLEPTKAQNFYDLARIQQQAGLLPQAVNTYNRLLTLISDPNQKQQVISEKDAIEKLISQAPNNLTPTTPTNVELVETPTPTLTFESPAIQANTNQGLIIATPETSKDVQVNHLTDSNSLSGNSTLPSQTKQISITNTNLKSTSQVYLTITKGGKNQSLQVLSKSKDSFTVGLDSPISEPIEFKWWIVN